MLSPLSLRKDLRPCEREMHWRMLLFTYIQKIAILLRSDVRMATIFINWKYLHFLKQLQSEGEEREGRGHVVD